MKNKSCGKDVDEACTSCGKPVRENRCLRGMRHFLARTVAMRPASSFTSLVHPLLMRPIVNELRDAKLQRESEVGRLQAGLGAKGTVVASQRRIVLRDMSRARPRASDRGLRK